MCGHSLCVVVDVDVDVVDKVVTVGAENEGVVEELREDREIKEMGDGNTRQNNIANRENNVVSWNGAARPVVVIVPRLSQCRYRSRCRTCVRLACCGGDVPDGRLGDGGRVLTVG